MRAEEPTHQHGYNTDIFFETSNISTHLLCSICFYVLREPVGCRDGHMYCKVCILKHFIRSKTCPTCRTKLDSTTLSINRTLENIIDEMNVLCLTTTNSAPNLSACEWLGLLKDAKIHYQECSYRIISCPHQGCDFQTMHKDMYVHTNVCVHQIVVCHWCSKRYKLLSHEDHEPCCPSRPIECPNGCTDGEFGNERMMVPADKLNDHFTVCKLQLVACPFKYSGCEDQIARKDIDAHLEGPIALTAHMFGMLKKIEKVEDSCAQKVAEVKYTCAKELAEVKDFCAKKVAEVKDTCAKELVAVQVVLERADQEIAELQAKLEKSDIAIKKLLKAGKEAEQNGRGAEQEENSDIYESFVASRSPARVMEPPRNSRHIPRGAHQEAVQKLFGSCYPSKIVRGRSVPRKVGQEAEQKGWIFERGENAGRGSYGRSMRRSGGDLKVNT